MTAIYDVAIIGAGPAGSVFAKELAVGDPSLKILIVDGQNDEQSKVCGGLLAPDAQKLLAKLNLTLPKNVLADPQIFAVETVDLSKKYVRYYQRHYLNMDRLAFDRWLLSLVPNSVEIINGRCVSINETDGSYKLKLRCNGSEIEYLAASIVGADGGGSLVRRSFFGRNIFQYIAIQQWFESDGEKLPYYSCIFDEKTSDSCSWTIRKNRYSVFGGAFEKSDCRRSFEKQKSRLEEFIGYKFGTPVKTEACLLSSPRKMSDFILGKKKIYLVGEAAGFISASSFEGISSAILSGKLLADAFLDGKDHEKILKLYKIKTLTLKIKLYFKIKKRHILCTPLLRHLIMKSGIESVKKYSSSHRK